MKYFFIGFCIWLAICWGIPQARYTIFQIKRRFRYKKADRNDKWLYKD